jgi:hypothetical protein
MTIAFILTMPNKGSWDGKWSGEENLYARTKRYTSKKAIAKIQPLIGRHFHYSWGDGWGANIECREVSGSESRSILKRSRGFLGYEWMIDEILEHGRIRPERERYTAAHPEVSATV